MHHWIRFPLFVFLVTLPSLAWAQESTALPSEAPISASETVSAPALVSTPENAAHYGFGARLRWITIPSWLLNYFTKKNMPLSSYGFAVEGVRRKKFQDDPKGAWEISMAAGYQGMSPEDGNWLGKNEDARDDTDLVQARGFGLITWDITFVGRQYFSPYFGMHYGAGLGLGIVTGKILRTSAANCTEANAGDTTVCRPICNGATCSEPDLQASEGQPDLGPDNPHRFRESSIPGAIPILNLFFGLDFPVPDAKGLEFRLEGGFYDAFFLGVAGGYVF